MGSLEERLGAVDPRLRTTRASFYRALIDWTAPVDPGGLPPLRWLLAASDSAESTFRSHFGVDKYADLQPCAGRRLSGVERVVMETKVLTLDPFVSGYREMTTRLHSSPTARLASLTTVVVTWALQFRALATMVPAVLPDSVDAAARHVAGSGPRADSAYVEIHELLRDAVGAAQGVAADAQAGEVMSTLSGRIGGILPIDDVQRASRELASHVGAFMLLTEGNHGDVDAELRFVLERALRLLHAGDGRGA